MMAHPRKISIAIVYKTIATVSMAMLLAISFMASHVSRPQAAPSSSPPPLDDKTLIVECLQTFREKEPHPQRAFFIQQIRPRLDIRHVSEFVIGRHEIQSFVERHRAYFETIYHKIQPGGTRAGYASFIEQFVAPDNVELGTFFFKERFGRNDRFPVVLFDAAFDGDGITTQGDLLAALQSYELPRLAHMSEGIDYGSFQLNRTRFLEQHLTAVKLVLECDAVNRILVDDRRGRIHLSDSFKGELQANYLRYYRMLERLVAGEFYTIDTVGNPSYIEAPLDLELGRAQLQRMDFRPPSDRGTGRLELLPAAKNQP